MTVQVLLRLGRRVAGVGASSIAQAIQSATSLLVLMLAARLLGIETLGLFSILYGALILAAAITSGFVGDSLTVLDRHDAHIQAGLRAWFMILAVGTGVAGLGLTLLGTQLGIAGAICYALASMAYIAEDLIRRSHMAIMNFGRLIVVDLVVLLTTGVVVGSAYLLGHVSVETFLIAIALGQLAGTVYGWIKLPPSEKVKPKRPAYFKDVAAFGSWRSAMQGLRPAQLTLVRIIVTVVISLTAAGQLEAARIYAAPAMLIVTGTNAYLFSDLARRTGVPMREQLRHTDSVVWKLVLATVGVAVIGLLLLPWGGPMLTGIVPSASAVTGWLAYSTAIAVSTPYGLLAAVREKAQPVFLVRFLDSILSLLLVSVVVVTTGDYQLVPWAAAVGAVAGGYAIRRWVVGAVITREETKQHGADFVVGTRDHINAELKRKEQDHS